MNNDRQTVDSDIVERSEHLAWHIMSRIQGENLHFLRHDRAVLPLLKCVAHLLQKHDILFSSFMNRLNITCKVDMDAAFESITAALFNDETVTWGRVITLYAFAARLAEDCEEKNMVKFARRIPKLISNSVKSYIVPFIRRQGGWDAIYLEFPIEENLGDKIWWSLLYTGTTLGAIATTLFILKQLYV